MRIPTATQSAQGRSIPLTAERLVNMFAEKAPPGSKAPAVVHGCPGLTRFADIDTRRTRGMYVTPADGRLYVVVRNSLYHVNADGVSTNLGTIAGSGRVGMADNGTQLVIVAGASGYVYTVAEGLQEITDDGFPGAVTVTYLDGYFIFNNPTPGQRGQFFISNLLDGTMHDATDFATAESYPDDLIHVFADHSELLLFGTRTIEKWFNAGNADFPFARAQGSIIEQGLGAVWSIAKVDETVFWLDDEGIVRRLQDLTPVRISTHAIEYDISRGDWQNATAWQYVQEGHSFYVLTVPARDLATQKAGTYVFDAATQLWHERKSYRQDYSRSGFYARAYGKHITADIDRGRLYEQSLDVYEEDGEHLIAEMQFPQIQNDGKRFIVHRLQLDMEVGSEVAVRQEEPTPPQPEAAPFFSDDLITYTGWGRSTGPSGIYDSGTDKTYVSWQFVGAGGNKGIHIAAYDHAGSSWSSRYTAGNFYLPDDDHGHPALCIDSEGYIYCFFGCHNNSLRWSISNVPNDHSEWSQQLDLTGSYTYPSPAVIGGTIYLFLRDGSNPNNRPVVLKTGTPSGGSVSFSTDITVVEMGSDSRVYRDSVHVVGADIHFASARSDSNDTERKGVYYFIYDTTNGSVRNFDGSTVIDSVDLPVDQIESDSNFRVFDHGLGNGDTPSLAFDSNGNAHILFADNENGPEHFLKHIWLDNNALPLSWSSPETVAIITDRSGFGFVDDYTCVSGASGSIEAWYTSQSGQQVRRVRSSAGVWSSEEVIINTSGVYQSSAVENATQELRVLTSLQISPIDANAENIDLYSYGDNGSPDGSIDVSTSDPLYNDVVTLLNFQHRNGNLVPIDSSRASLRSTLNGNASVDNQSLLLDGVGDYLEYVMGDITGHSVSSGDLTIEAFVTLNTIGVVHSVANKTSSFSVGEYRFNINSSNLLNCFAFDGSSSIVMSVTGSTPLSSGVEQHVALSRQGSTWRLFLNGSLEDISTESTPPASNSIGLWVGRDHNDTNRDFDGRIRGFRFTSSARYTSSFTPPTYPLPEQ